MTFLGEFVRCPQAAKRIGRKSSIIFPVTPLTSRPWRVASRILAPAIGGRAPPRRSGWNTAPLLVFAKPQLSVGDFPLAVHAAFSVVPPAMPLPPLTSDVAIPSLPFLISRAEAEVPGVRPSCCCSAAGRFPQTRLRGTPHAVNPSSPRSWLRGPRRHAHPLAPAVQSLSSLGTLGWPRKSAPCRLPPGQRNETTGGVSGGRRESRATQAPGAAPAGPAPRRRARGAAGLGRGHSEGLGCPKEPRLEEGPPP